MARRVEPVRWSSSAPRRRSARPCTGGGRAWCVRGVCVVCACNPCRIACHDARPRTVHAGLALSGGAPCQRWWWWCPPQVALIAQCPRVLHTLCLCTSLPHLPPACLPPIHSPTPYPLACLPPTHLPPPHLPTHLSTHPYPLPPPPTLYPHPLPCTPAPLPLTQGTLRLRQPHLDRHDALAYLALLGPPPELLALKACGVPLSSLTTHTSLALSTR